MAFNPPKFVHKLLESCSPNPAKAGKTLLVINALGMVFAALSNTYAAAVDKNTSAQDKKFLVPAGFVTGAANIGLYYAMTTKIIDALHSSESEKPDSPIRYPGERIMQTRKDSKEKGIKVPIRSLENLKSML